MAVNAANVAAGTPDAAGGILTAPVGTALPTNESTAPNAAFKALGLVSDSGLESSGDAPSITDIKAWGGTTVASLTEDKGTRKYTFNLIEMFNTDASKLVFGTANVTVTAASSSAGTKLAIQDKGDTIAVQPYIFEMKYQAKKMRIVVPRGQLVITSERPFVDNDVAGYECELTCLPDSSGVLTYRYYANDDLTA